MDADLLFARLGAATVSHPEEYDAIIADLRSSGVDLQYREGTLAYSPKLEEPGRMILVQQASIAAVRHEYQHFLDHREAGYPGFQPYFEDANLFVLLETRGYQREIETVHETGNDDLIPHIVAQMQRRIRELFGEEFHGE